jgi:hypothetical protein
MIIVIEINNNKYFHNTFFSQNALFVLWKGWKEETDFFQDRQQQCKQNTCSMFYKYLTCFVHDFYDVNIKHGPNK